jgi:hypothetical protein
LIVSNLMAFIGLPIAFFATSSGLGLLIERIARTRLPNQLLAPLGFCAAVSLMLSVFSLGGHIVAAVVVLVAASAAGFVLAGRSMVRAVTLGWSGVAALAVYALYILPMAGTGGWTWLGYNFLNDTSVQFGLIAHLKVAGTTAVGLPMTTGGETLRTYLETGYPLGTHAYAAALSGLLSQPIEVVYQSFLAAMAATAALGLAVVARTVAGPRAAAALGAIALGSNLTFQYAMQGDIKEIGVLAALCTVAAITTELPSAASPFGTAAVLGVSLAAVFSVYNAAGIPYVAAAGATAVIVLLIVRGRKAVSRTWLAAAGLAIAVTAVASAAALATMSRFYSVASAVVSSTSPTGSALGQLAHPLGLLQASGIWLDGRYFEPIAPHTLDNTLTVVASWLIVALTACALLEAIRRRRPEILVAIVPVALATLLVTPRVSPYAGGKLLAILSPAAVLSAGVGLLFLSRFARPVAVALGAGLLLAIGISDSFAYHDDKPAPQARMTAIEDAVAHTPGTGLILFNEFEEFAKYFDPTGRVNVGSESITPRPVQLLVSDSRFDRLFDLDQEQLGYVQSFGNIIIRRSPSASRPPSSFRLAYANRFYEVWTRDSQPLALLHLPLGNNASSASGPARCTAVARLVHEARGLGTPTALVAAQAPTTIVFDVTRATTRSPDWPLNGPTPGSLTLAGPGQAQGTVDVPQAGRFTVWVRGDFPRAVRVQVDGRDVGAVSGINTPGEWLAAGSVDLAAGPAAVRAYAGGGSLRPGDGALGLLGPVALVSQDPAKLIHVGLAGAGGLCGRTLDWIEVVPASASAARSTS